VKTLAPPGQHRLPHFVSQWRRRIRIEIHRRDSTRNPKDYQSLA
jgi:hypothetical protein